MNIFDVAVGAVKLGSEIKQQNMKTQQLNMQIQQEKQNLNSFNCPQCGYVLPKGAMFCSRCGNKALSVSQQQYIQNQQYQQIQQQQRQLLQQQQQLLQQQQQQQKMQPQVYLCAGCRAPLTINRNSEILVCPYCDLQNVNPYYEKPVQQVAPAPMTAPMTPPMYAPMAVLMGQIRFMFETMNNSFKNIAITIPETGDMFLLTNGQSKIVQLKKGVYTISFAFGERKYYKRTVRIYSQFTDITIVSTSARTRNVINIGYAGSITIPLDMINFRRYHPEEYTQNLRSAGFVNVENITRAGYPGEKLFNFGRVTDVLIEEVSISNAVSVPENLAGIGEVIIKDGMTTGIRVPHEARICVVS